MAPVILKMQKRSEISCKTRKLIEMKAKITELANICTGIVNLPYAQLSATDKGFRTAFQYDFTTIPQYFLTVAIYG